jgi:hypothetical protein
VGPSGGPLPIPQQELTGPAGVSSTTTIAIVVVVFLAIAMLGVNYPKAGKPLMIITIAVLGLEAYRKGL